jgi:hypothetical protein
MTIIKMIFIGVIFILSLICTPRLPNYYQKVYFLTVVSAGEKYQKSEANQPADNTKNREKLLKTAES